MNRMAHMTIRAVMVLSTISGAAALADDFDLDWWTVDGGGDMWTSGGEFELSGTIGQPDASTTVMTGGDFELTGGFWPVATVPFCPGDIDGDGDTDHSDLGELLAAWCTHEGDPNWNPNADLDADGHVGHGDLGTLLADWGCGT
ncbi:MAG TPA: hypothetical protein VM487_11100 [Phycisphaerae bacterium]|nr:hypothetical protein [Phycisphaerae bacterium]